MSGVIRILLAIASLAAIQVGAFRASPSRVVGPVRCLGHGNTGNGRGMQPLNTNPRKIDVGEESIARFGKVSTSFCENGVCVVVWSLDRKERLYGSTMSPFCL